MIKKLWKGIHTLELFIMRETGQQKDHRITDGLYKKMERVKESNPRNQLGRLALYH